MEADEAGTSGDLAVADEGVEYERVVVLNPVSGDADHRDRVRRLAAEYDFTVLETQEEGDAVEFAREAAENDASLVAAAGGDGTVNEVVRGLVAADALDSVAFGVVPVGTGNNFAGNVGVRNVEQAFELLDGGERRRVDLGTADGRVFVNSCVGGLTATASGETDSEEKQRLGVLAYVLNTLRVMTDFEGLPLSVEASAGGEVSWSGEALFVLVGNGRRFPAKGQTQANMEDGLLDVTIIERMPASDLIEEAAVQRLFGHDTENVTHMRTPTLSITVEGDEPVSFSLDGEMDRWRNFTLGVDEGVLELVVGPDYEPAPEV